MTVPSGGCAHALPFLDSTNKIRIYSKKPTKSYPYEEGWIDEYESLLALEKLVGLYKSLEGNPLREVVLRTLDNPNGYIRLAAHQFYVFDSPQDVEDVEKILSACSDERHAVLFSAYSGMVDVKSVYRSRTKKDILGNIMAGDKASYMNYVKAGKEYMQIANPTLEQSKKALAFCLDKDGGVSEAQMRVASLLSEADMRELLPQYRDTSPEAYWFLWGKCATEDEAKQVLQSKADAVKKCRAVRRIHDDAILKAALQKETNGSVRCAIYGALCDVSVLAEVASNFSDNTDADERNVAFGRLTDVNRYARTKEVAFAEIVKSIEANIGKLGFAARCDEAIEYLSKIEGQSDNIAVLKGGIDKVAERIMSDGRSVADEVFEYKGLRLGMLEWEFQLMKSRLGIDGIKCETYAFQKVGIRNRFVSGKRVMTISFTVDALKECFGLASNVSNRVLSDRLGETFGTGGNGWKVSDDEFLGSGNVLVRWTEDTPPPFTKCRKVTQAEYDVLKSEKNNIAKQISIDKEENSGAFISKFKPGYKPPKPVYCRYCGEEFQAVSPGFARRPCTKSPTGSCVRPSDGIHCIHCGLEGKAGDFCGDAGVGNLKTHVL